MRGTFFKRLLRDDRAATAVEYGLILALVVLAIMGAINVLANETTGMWGDVQEEVVEAVQGD